MHNLRDIQHELTSKIDQFVEYAKFAKMAIQLTDDPLIGDQPLLFDTNGIWIRNYPTTGYYFVKHAYITYDYFYDWVYSNEPDLIQLEQALEPILTPEVGYELIQVHARQWDAFKRVTVAEVRFDVCVNGKRSREPDGDLTKEQVLTVAKLITPIASAHKVSLVIPAEYVR